MNTVEHGKLTKTREWRSLRNSASRRPQQPSEFLVRALKAFFPRPHVDAPAFQPPRRFSDVRRANSNRGVVDHSRATEFSNGRGVGEHSNRVDPVDRAGLISSAIRADPPTSAMRPGNGADPR